mgnify:CR=1 FL=1
MATLPRPRQHRDSEDERVRGTPVAGGYQHRESVMGRRQFDPSIAKSARAGKSGSPIEPSQTIGVLRGSATSLAGPSKICNWIWTATGPTTKSHAMDVEMARDVRGRGRSRRQDLVQRHCERRWVAGVGTWQKFSLAVALGTRSGRHAKRADSVYLQRLTADCQLAPERDRPRTAMLARVHVAFRHHLAGRGEAQS